MTDLQSLLESEDMDLSCPLVNIDNDNMRLLMQAKQERQLVHIAQGGEGVRDRNKACTHSNC